MITACTMAADFATSARTFDPLGTPRCGASIPAEQWERGPWMCSACQEVSRRKAAGIASSYVPMVADVHRAMTDYGISQDDATRIQGGQP